MMMKWCLAVVCLQNAVTFAQTPQVSLATPVVTLGTNVAKRDEEVTVSIPSVSDLGGALITLAGKEVKFRPQNNALVMTVPSHQPLGPSEVVVKIQDHTYSARDKLNVLAARTEPGIDSMRLSPPSPADGRVSIDIFGHGFSTAVLTDPYDISLLVDHSPRQVNWFPSDRLETECTAAAKDTSAKPAALIPIYGSVISESQVRVCNVAATNGILPIGLHQGEDVPSKAESLVVSDWNTTFIRIVAALVAVFLICLVYFLLSFKGAHIVKDRSYRLKAMFLDKQTNTYSLSILQFHMWTAATLFGYTFYALSKLFVQRGGVIADVPGGVPGIVGIGIGAGTAVAAQLIQGVNAKGAGEETPSPSDLVTSGGAVAPDRVQMLVWTFIAVGMFIAAVWVQEPATIKGLPEIPSTLMQLMGLSSLGYLGGKFARKPGPNILELSIIPATALPAGGSLTTVAPVDVTAPKSKAAQALDGLKKISAGLTDTSAPAAVREANSAVSALESAVAAAAGAGGPAGLPKLIELTDSAHNAAVNAAAEFERVNGTPGSEIARVSANIAQRAATAVQDLSAGVSELVAAAETSASRRAAEETQAFRRTIEIRGSNLSAEGIFRVKIKSEEEAKDPKAPGQNYDIPFRMLEEKDGVRAPVIVVPEENSGNAKFARILQLNIVPASLDPVDKKTYDAIFGTKNKGIEFTIFNPDGQKAMQSFDMPPGEGQRP
jgi:hypothetical protein